MNLFKKSLSFEKDSLLAHRYRRLGLWICILAIPAGLLIKSLLLITLNLDSHYWDEWGLYTMHLPLSLGLYLILFSEERQEDEFYLSLRLHAVARGVIMIVTAEALLPVFANLSNLVVRREAILILPDVGGNMAVCTLLLFYANLAYAYNKHRTAKDD